VEHHRQSHLEDKSHVSREMIYRSLFVQGRGVLKKGLLQHLRSKRTIFRSKRACQHGEPRTDDGSLVDP
jgi:hypothetical protein